jgi:hypothetical protein
MFTEKPSTNLFDGDPSEPTDDDTAALAAAEDGAPDGPDPPADDAGERPIGTTRRSRARAAAAPKSARDRSRGDGRPVRRIAVGIVLAAAIVAAALAVVGTPGHREAAGRAPGVSAAVPARAPSSDVERPPNRATPQPSSSTSADDAERRADQRRIRRLRRELTAARGDVLRLKRSVRRLGARRSAPAARTERAAHHARTSSRRRAVVVPTTRRAVRPPAARPGAAAAHQRSGDPSAARRLGVRRRGARDGPLGLARRRHPGVRRRGLGAGSTRTTQTQQPQEGPPAMQLIVRTINPTRLAVTAAGAIPALAVALVCAHAAIIKNAAGIGAAPADLAPLTRAADGLVDPMLVAMAAIVPLAVIGGLIASALGSRRGWSIVITALGALAVAASVKGVVA